MKTIRDYVDIIKKECLKEYLKEDESIFYVADLLELENEDTGEEFEIFRLVKMNNSTKEAVVTDFEYSEEEDLVLKWEADADYSKINEMDLTDKNNLNDLILIADDFLIYDFIVTELHHYK